MLLYLVLLFTIVNVHVHNWEIISTVPDFSGTNAKVSREGNDTFIKVEMTMKVKYKMTGSGNASIPQLSCLALFFSLSFSFFFFSFLEES